MLSKLKTISNIVVVVIILSHGISMASNLENSIIGKWQKINDTEIIEFCADGSATITDTFLNIKKPLTFPCAYKLIDEDTIKITPLVSPYIASIVYALVPYLFSELLTISTTGEIATLTTLDGKMTKYERIKEGR